MKFTCEKDALVKEISIAQEIISSKNALSILSNVLLEADNNTLTIKATDLKVSFETRLPVEVAVPGSTTIFCDKFLGILRTLPAGEIEFEEKENDILLIKPLFKKIDFRLKTISADKYPEIQTASDEIFFDFSQKDIMEMISQTIFSVSDDETRYYMNGVYMEKNEDKLVMVATDGRRLSFISKKPGNEIPDFQPVIIPPKALHLVRKLASGEGNISLAITDKNVFIRFDNQKISSALIEGQFPNYQRVIPAEQTYRIRVSKDELLEAIKRVSLLVEQKSRRIYLNLQEKTMILSSEESEIGIAKEEIGCDYMGSETIVALNFLYLVDPLRVIEDSEIFVEFTEPNKAITLRSTEEREYFHIVMPMQLEQYMGFASLRFFHFRNLADEKVPVDAPEVFLVGENGQGKTNVLEAVYYLSFGASFRTRKDDTVVRHEEDEAALEGQFLSDSGPETSTVIKFSSAGKDIRLDGKIVRDRRELVGRFPCIVFCHDDIFFVSGPPDQQRLFFNQTLSLSDPGFIDLWRRYSRLLKQRNAAVKNHDWDMVDLYDPDFAEAGIELSLRREEVVKMFSGTFARLFEEISGIKTAVDIRYAPSWKSKESGQILQDLKKRRDTDAALFTTTSGPHRDRFRFYFGNRDFTSTASTGQVRLASLILKTAQAVHYAEMAGRRPILLLDDVLLEMDPTRRKRFISRLPAYEQAFFTFLPDEPFSSYKKHDTLVYHVSGGRLRKDG